MARRNTNLLYPKGKVEVSVDVIYGDAEACNFYDKSFYLYNPLDEVFMEWFVDILNGSISGYPRMIHIIYCDFFTKEFFYQCI